MAAATGTEQRTLQRLTVQWGPQVRRYRVVVPFFDAGYKVLGLAAVGSDFGVTWYPGAPWKVEPHRLAYKDLGLDAPPPWSEVPTGLLERAYFFDPTGAIALMLPRQPGAPSLAGAVNLTGTSLRGQSVQDIVFEPALHRVRALMLGGRWGRVQRVSVMRLGALPRGLPSVVARVPASDAGQAPLGDAETARVPQALSPADEAVRAPAPIRPLSSGTPGQGRDSLIARSGWGLVARLLGIGPLHSPSGSQR